MKSSIITKIKISIFLCIISLIYFFCFDFLFERIDFSLFGFLFILLRHGWFIVLGSFLLVFAYPYIKIHSQSVIKRGLFFGLIVWIINMPQILMDLRHTLMMFDIVVAIPLVLLFIKNLLLFVILGLVIGFCYRKFLPTEFNLSLKKLKTPFIKIIFAIISTALIYLLFMYFVQVLILHFLVHIDIWNYIIMDFLSPWLYINPLIYGLMFTMLYITTIGKADISRIKKWILFSIFVSFFTTPLIILPGAIGLRFFQDHTLISELLLLPHVLSIFIIGYIFIKLFNKASFAKPHLELNNK